MTTRSLALLLVAASACASANTRAAAPVMSNDQLALGLSAGAHEMVLNGARQYYRIAGAGELGRALFAAGVLRYRFTDFARMTMPVLGIADRFDGAAGPVGVRELVRRLPDARYVEFEHSGHFVYLDEPERFATEVASFVLGR
jgi:pimeloyl-ACP methyl ester carboxylesterase